MWSIATYGDLLESELKIFCGKCISYAEKQSLVTESN